MAVPYTFGSATAAIPLSQLDSNFATTITLGNTAVQLGNTITNLTGVSNLASASALSLGSNGNTTAVTIDTSQNVGIGTSSPNTKFTVNGNANLAGNLYTPDYGYIGNSGGTFSGINTGFQTLSGGSGYLLALTNGNERMRIDSSGNVGIGTSTPSTYGKLAVVGSGFNGGNANFVSTSSGNSITVTGVNGAGVNDVAYYNFTDGTNNAFIGLTGTNATAGALRFSTGTSPTERMRIDSSGNLLVGTTSKGSIPGNSIVVSNGYGARAGVGGGLGGSAFNLYWTGSATQLWIDGTNTGTITVVSDYRLKDKVETQTTPALSRINQLRPVTYEFKDYGSIFKADGVAREGFIAHEVQAVIPSAVEGEKDSENQIQSLKLDALCSVMVKAIQELNAKFEEYKATHP